MEKRAELESLSIDESSPELLTADREEPGFAEWRDDFTTKPSLIRAMLGRFAAMPIGWRGYFVAITVASLATTLFVRGESLTVAMTLLMVAWQPFTDWGNRIRDSWDRRKLQSHADAPDQELVRLKIRAGGLVVGEDEGTAIIVDDMLVFAGKRTHFAVSSKYVKFLGPVKGILSRSAGEEPAQQERIWVIGYSAFGQEFQASIEPIPALWSEQSIAAFGRQCTKWASSLAPVGAHCVLPPAVPAPNSYLPSQRLRILAFQAPLFCLICLGPALASLSEGLLVRVVVPGVLLLVAMVVGLLRSANKHDRGIEALERKVNSEPLPLSRGSVPR